MPSNDNLAELYRDVLLEDVIPFWTNHSIDSKCGGYFTCLDRKGEVFDTDKFVWLQGRQAWMYSKIYNEVNQNGEWLDIARLGAEFLRDHAMDDGGNFYFSLDRSGKPLVQPYNIFSDCFASMAFSEYARASGEDWAVELAVDTFKNIQKRAGNPKGQYSKAHPGTRPLVSLALPMITINLTLELKSHIDDPALDEAIEANINLVMDKLVDRDLGLIFENVSPDGSHPDTFDGRLVLPGHGIEAMWFIMDTARALGRNELIEPAATAMLKQLEFGWDDEDGGIYYFMDSMGKPSVYLEWAQKLWWVHLEALVGTALAHELTGNELYWEWYQKIHEYSWERFPDPDYGEWWGYLDRHGRLLIPLKGGKWKGCFHVPRAMFELWRIFERLGN
jgi:N-acylglucosamine 2-epimerase